MRPGGDSLCEFEQYEVIPRDAFVRSPPPPPGAAAAAAAVAAAAVVATRAAARFRLSVRSPCAQQATLSVQDAVGADSEPNSQNQVH